MLILRLSAPQALWHASDGYPRHQGWGAQTRCNASCSTVLASVWFDAHEKRLSALKQCRRKHSLSTSGSQRHKAVAIRAVFLCNV